MKPAMPDTYRDEANNYYAQNFADYSIPHFPKCVPNILQLSPIIPNISST